MKTIRNMLLVLTCLAVLPAAAAWAGEPWCQGEPGVCVTNITSTAFTVSWVTLGSDELASVQWGTASDNLNNTAYDERDAVILDEAHHILIAGLAPQTTYYFTVTSGGVTYDDGGEPFSAKTGPSLAPTMPEFMVIHVYLSDGETPAVGAIVYLQSFSGEEESAVQSKILSDAGGMVLFDLNSLRTTDYSSYFAWSNNDLFIVVDGQSMGYEVYEGGVPAASPPLGPTMDIILTDCTGCLIDGVCYRDGDYHPDGICGLCDTNNNRFRWTFADAAIVCRAAVNNCDVAETCTGDSALCPADAFVAAGQVCAPAGAELCDADNVCAGDSATCVPTFRAAGAVCRAAVNNCDVAEVCTGDSAECPTDVYASAGTVCLAAAGDCDMDDTCAGNSATCLVNFRGAGVTCRAAINACDIAENCTGDSAECPADVYASAGTVCLAAAGDCDMDDTCAGNSATCLTHYRDAGVVCRAAVNDCDIAESCAGDSPACPADAFAPDTTVCQTAAGDCDLDDFCAGNSAECVDSGYRSPETVCRPSAGDCDRAENCTGSAAECPIDELLDAGTVCRAATGECDLAEICDGSAASCPADVFVQAGEACEDDAFCTVNDACDGQGACAPGQERDCADEIACTDDFCDENSDQCVNDDFVCLATVVAPNCPKEVTGPGIEIPVIIDQVDGEDEIGFSMTYDSTLLTFVEYDLEGSVLQAWGEDFTCEVNPPLGRIDCTGASDLSLDPEEQATLVTFIFDPNITELLFLDEQRTTHPAAFAGKVLSDSRVRRLGMTSDLNEMFSESLGCKLEEPEAEVLFSVFNLLGDLELMIGEDCVSDFPIADDEDDDNDNDDNDNDDNNNDTVDDDDDTGDDDDTVDDDDDDDDDNNDDDTTAGDDDDTFLPPPDDDDDDAAEENYASNKGDDDGGCGL